MVSFHYFLVTRVHPYATENRFCPPFICPKGFEFHAIGQVYKTTANTRSEISDAKTGTRLFERRPLKTNHKNKAEQVVENAYLHLLTSAETEMLTWPSKCCKAFRNIYEAKAQHFH